MNVFKRTVLAAGTVALLTTAAQAGGLDEPRIEPEVMAPATVVEESTRSQKWIIPLFVLALVAAVASG